MKQLKPGKYQHYKGKFYEVIGVARHRETLEELVVYRALYDSDEFGKNSLWVRPKKMFMENVVVDGKEIPRFRFIEEKKNIGVGFGVMLLKDGKLLLGRRHDDVEKASSLLNGAGTWTMPGGKLHFGETFEDGAKREVLEETGITLNKMDVICVNQDIIETAHFITTGVFSDAFSGEPEVMEPDEITEWRWFDLNNLPSPIYFPSAKVIENYKRKKFFIF